MPEDILSGSTAGSTDDSPPSSTTTGADVPTSVAPTTQEQVAIGSPTVADGASAPDQSGQPATAGGSAEDSPTSTEDAFDKASADPELSAKPGFQNLRQAYQTLKDKVAELETSQVDSYLKIDAPVDDWKVEEQLDSLATNLAPYYNKMAWNLMERHLPDVLPVLLDNPTKLPPDLAPLVEASATAILRHYTGMEPEEIGEAIQLYRSGRSAPVVAGTGMTGTPTDLTQLAQQADLDPANPQHFALLNNFSAMQKELAALKASVDDVRQKEVGRFEESGRQKLVQQIESFKGDLLAKVQLPQGYEHVQSEIADRLAWAFERDPAVITAKANLEKFYKQGTPDLKAAASEVGKLQTRMAFHFKSIAEPRLAEVAELEKLKTQTSQQQAGVRNIAPGAGTGTSPAPQTRSGVVITPDNAADIALERWRASKIGKPA